MPIVFQTQANILPSGGGGGGGAPAYWPGLTSLQWTSIAGAGKQIQDVASSPTPQIGSSGTQASLMSAWTGAAVDQGNLYYLHLNDGGHGDYAGDEGYLLQLNRSTLSAVAWQRFLDPTPNSKLVYSDASSWTPSTGFLANPQPSGVVVAVVTNGGNRYVCRTSGTSGTGGGPTGTGIGISDGGCTWDYLGPASHGAINADGRPCSMHTVGFQCYADGAVWFPYNNSYSSGGGGNDPAVRSFDMTNAGVTAAIASGTPLAWDGTVGPWSFWGMPALNDNDGQDSFGFSSFDAARHQIYSVGGHGFDRANGFAQDFWVTQTQGGSKGVTTIYSYNLATTPLFGWMIYCPNLNVCVAGDEDSGDVVVFDVTNLGGTGWYTRVTPTGTPYNGVSGSAFPGSTYFPAVRQIGIGDPVNIGSTVYKLQIPAGASYAALIGGTWSWSHTTYGGATVSGSNDPHTYQKFNKIDDMGDGRAALIYCGGVNSPTYIMPVPGTGL